MSVEADMSLFKEFKESTPVYTITKVVKRGEQAYFPEPGFAGKVKRYSSKFTKDWRVDNYL